HLRSTPFPYTTLFRSEAALLAGADEDLLPLAELLFRPFTLELHFRALAGVKLDGGGTHFRGLLQRPVETLALDQRQPQMDAQIRSEEHTSELQSRENL